MSLILEALKKSEQQRRLGEAPTLGSPVLAVRRSRSLLPLFAALVIIALGVGWWLSRSPTLPPQAPVEAPAPVAAATKPTAPAAPDGKSAAASAGKKPAPHFTTPATPTAPPAAKPIETMQPTPLRNDRTATTIPTPVAAPAHPPAAAPAEAKPDAAKTPAASANATAPAAAAATSTTSTAAATPNAAPAVPTAAAPSTAAATPMPHAAATAAAQPALPSVWELPYATRKDIPELALTMHVYATDPAQRFVVIKGERHAEGDDLGDGLVLKEIRADGMVLDYKGQRFVYPRDSR
ncbi:MAG: general secretion pathway protein GspB [Dokdonella sp.]